MKVCELCTTSLTDMNFTEQIPLWVFLSLWHKCKTYNRKNGHFNRLIDRALISNYIYVLWLQLLICECLMQDIWCTNKGLGIVWHFSILVPKQYRTFCTFVMTRGSRCSVPPLRVKPQGALPRSSTCTSSSSSSGFLCCPVSLHHFILPAETLRSSL